MRDVDTAFVEDILDVAQREQIADIHHHGQADDFRGGFEISKEGRGCHCAKVAALLSAATDFNLTLPVRNGTLSPVEFERQQNMSAEGV